MKWFCSSSSSLFLVVLVLFPALPRAKYADHPGTGGFREDSSRQGANGSHFLHQQVKRYLLPITPPFLEIESDLKVVNCKKSEGFCQDYCNYMETQVGYCVHKKYACCLHRHVLKGSILC
ncbi:sperm-associated antigen 11B-like [Erinaceus europaeus]|uniref:Sperm-associated antigen 11B-like n=1 Tax=Erinaceus europaeus TaxID=9365 RepID=A0ABM3VU87_ERIEU|nr:sperm-associated antigen 11B-like [Erinaceus europaeus]